MTVTRIGIINSRYSCQLSANLRFKLLPPRTLTAALLFTMISPLLLALLRFVKRFMLVRFNNTTVFNVC